MYGQDELYAVFSYTFLSSSSWRVMQTLSTYILLSIFPITILSIYDAVCILSADQFFMTERLSVLNTAIIEAGVSTISQCLGIKLKNVVCLNMYYIFIVMVKLVSLADGVEWKAWVGNCVHIKEHVP